MENNARAHVIISGRVQGVCYRLETQAAAKALGVLGWVRNLYDGTVEAVFEGEKDSVDKMIDWCRKGPRMATVSNVEIQWESCTGEFEEFRIVH